MLVPQDAQQNQDTVWTSLYRDNHFQPVLLITSIATDWLRARGKDFKRHMVPALPR